MNRSIDPDQIIAGRHYLLFLCGLLWIVGLILIVEGGLVVQTSGAYYTGAWYLGLLNVLTGFRGCIMKTVSSVRWLLLWTVVDTLASIIACAFVLPEYRHSQDFKACASYNDHISTSCGFASNLTCYGDASFYRNVSQCELSFLEGQNDDYQFEDDQCDCITSSYSCHSFDFVPSCSSILNFLPEGLLVSFSLSVVSLCLSLSLLILCVLSVYYPTVFLSDEEVARLQEHILQVAEARVAERTERTERENVAVAAAISPLHHVDEDNHTVVSAAIIEPSTIVLRPSEVVVLRESETRQREQERETDRDTETENHATEGAQSVSTAVAEAVPVRYEV